MNKFLIRALISIFVLAFIKLNQCHSIDYGPSDRSYVHGSVRYGQVADEHGGHGHHRHRHRGTGFRRGHDANGLDYVGEQEYDLVIHVQLGDEYGHNTHNNGQGRQRQGGRRGSDFIREHDAENMNNAGRHEHRRGGREHRYHAVYGQGRHGNEGYNADYFNSLERVGDYDGRNAGNINHVGRHGNRRDERVYRNHAVHGNGDHGSDGYIANDRLDEYEYDDENLNHAGSRGDRRGGRRHRHHGGRSNCRNGHCEYGHGTREHSVNYPSLDQVNEYGGTGHNGIDHDSVGHYGTGVIKPRMF